MQVNVALGLFIMRLSRVPSESAPNTADTGIGPTKSRHSQDTAHLLICLFGLRETLDGIIRRARYSRALRENQSIALTTHNTANPRQSYII